MNLPRVITPVVPLVRLVQRNHLIGQVSQVFALFRQQTIELSDIALVGSSDRLATVLSFQQLMEPATALQWLHAARNLRNQEVYILVLSLLLTALETLNE